MQIKRTSPLTGKENVMEIDVTEEQLAAWRGGELIQNAMPQLSADEREFILSGLMPADWDSLFGGEEEDED